MRIVAALAALIVFACSVHGQGGVDPGKLGPHRFAGAGNKQVLVQDLPSSTTSSSEMSATSDLPEVDVGTADKTRFEYIQVIPSSSTTTTVSVAKSKLAVSPPQEDLELMSLTGLEFLGSIYNPHRWNALPSNLSPQCKVQLKSYLGALQNGTTWAVQMTDASGRYSSQFFFGNDFWLGSHTLCEELETSYAISNPPWPVTFHVATIAVHLGPELTPHTRVLSLGVCLPRSCDPQDISALVHLAKRGPIKSAKGPTKGGKGAVKSTFITPSLDMLRIRRVPGPYSLLADPKLHILAGVSAAVVVLMVAGAVLEILWERSERRMADTEQQSTQEMHEQGCKGSEGLAKQKPVSVPVPDEKKAMQVQARLRSQQAGILVQIVTAFSPLSNGRKILCCEVNEEDSLTAVHGLRFMSLAWVILVHTYLQVFAIAENKTLRTVTERNFMFQTVSNATFSVDTFFFISGLLVAFLYFKTASRAKQAQQDSAQSKGASQDAQKPKKGVAADILKFFILLGYRFIRLTPAYLFVLGLVELSMRWIHNNSVFEPKILDHLNCDQYWWRNVLYINSLFPRKDMCMLWSWYMSNDTQFYVIGILLLLMSSRYFRLVAGALGTLFLSSWITTAFVSVHYEYKARIQEPFDKFDELYDKPWTRLGPYLVGMVTGWLLFKTKCRIRMSLGVVLVGWALSLLCLASLVYGLLHHKLGIAASAAYVSLGHTAWAVALGWIVVACCTGHGGYINTLLSFRALYPLSRLTYCAYLLHPMIMVLTSYQMDGPLHLHNALVLTLYFGNVVASFLLSFVISLAYEAPVVRLLKIALLQPPRK